MHMFSPRYNLIMILRNLAVDLLDSTTLIKHHQHVSHPYMVGSTQSETKRNNSRPGMPRFCTFTQNQLASRDIASL